MESIKDFLTNEKLRKKYTSQFDLVNYAIRLAENMIKSGRGPRVKTDVQNLALQILEEIAAGKDQFDEIIEESVIVAEIPEHINSRENRREEFAAPKTSEKKKPRKILAD